MASASAMRATAAATSLLLFLAASGAAGYSFVPARLDRGSLDVAALSDGRSPPPCTFASLGPLSRRMCGEGAAEVSSASNTLTMKVSRGKSRKTPRKSSSISVTHASRVRSAGRVGTKRYVDPAKCFVGNLSFETDEDDVMDLLSDYLGPRVADMNVESVKIVRDWRTGRSKGYGFVQFLDPMMATSAMEGLNGKEFMGRRINFGQGQRRKDPDRIWIKRRERTAEAGDAEDAILDAALDEAEGVDSDTEEISSVEDFNEVDDDSLFEEGEGDEDDFEFDGVFEEVYKKELSDDVEDLETMNRAQRREAAKGKKKRKLPHTGFG